MEYTVSRNKKWKREGVGIFMRRARYTAGALLIIFIEEGLRALCHSCCSFLFVFSASHAGGRTGERGPHAREKISPCKCGGGLKYELRRAISLTMRNRNIIFYFGRGARAFFSTRVQCFFLLCSVRWFFGLRLLLLQPAVCLLFPI